MNRNTKKFQDIMKRVHEHYKEACTLFSEDHIVGIFLQGSQNYGLDIPGSDIDTKLIVVPTFKDIALNRKPVSTTHVRANDEHIDLKDIRLYIETFTKQNLNFLEILFTDYYIINPIYEKQWNRLIEAREEIARMNPHRAVKSMKGIALEKYHAMKHPYPSKLDLIEKYRFDGKQVHHLVRVNDFMSRYIAGESYKDCLKPNPELIPHLLDYKQHKIPLEVAQKESDEILAQAVSNADAFCNSTTNAEDTSMRELLQDVSYNIMKIATVKDFT